MPQQQPPHPNPPMVHCINISGTLGSLKVRPPNVAHQGGALIGAPLVGQEQEGQRPRLNNPVRLLRRLLLLLVVVVGIPGQEGNAAAGRLARLCARRRMIDCLTLICVHACRALGR